ncbi:MAG: DeoR/GlpR family DNA-binding transcription regulator [Breznakia sp.]
MLAKSRQNMLVNIVNRKKSVSVLDLMKKLQVSEVTIRRDIIALDKAGLLRKVHGGALSIRSIQEIDSDVSFRENHNIEAKKHIAKFAAKLIEDYECIYLDAGSTIGCMIDYIHAEHINVVTNSITHARRLTALGITTYLLGGCLKVSTDAMVGDDAITMLDTYHFAKGFFGSNGVDKVYGFTTPDRREAEVKKHALKKCKHSYILIDDSKFDTISAVQFAHIQDATVLSNTMSENYIEFENVKGVDT